MMLGNRGRALAAIGLICLVVAVAPMFAPQDPWDLAGIDLTASLTPPVFAAGGGWQYPLGTDEQGRDMLSCILYGARLSLGIGAGAVLLGAVIGVTVGLASALGGRFADACLMRLADVQLTFPGILVALLADGIARAALPEGAHERLAVPVVVGAIGLSLWPQFARTVRASALVLRGRDFVLAARLAGVRPTRVALTHIVPNLSGPVAILAVLNLALAMLAEATLSFLGVGLPPTQPSLGTLIHDGNDYLMSGQWWVALCPAVVLVVLVLAVNVAGEAKV